MPLNVYLAQVRQICPELDEAQIDIFRQGLNVHSLLAGDIFIRTGDTPMCIGFIISGLLKAVYTDSEGNRVNVNFFHEGMGVGDYQAFRERSLSRYDFIAIEPCELVLFSIDHFETCSRKIPILERIYRIVLERALFDYVRRTERFLITDATKRYLDFIDASPNLFKRLSISDLCSYLGIKRQTLTRIRKQILLGKP